MICNDSNDNQIQVEIKTTNGPFRLAEIICDRSRIMHGLHYYNLKINDQLVLSAIFEDNNGKPGDLFRIEGNRNFDSFFVTAVALKQNHFKNEN